MQFTSLLILVLLLLSPLMVSCRPQGEREEKQHQIVGMGNLANFLKFKSGDGEKLKVEMSFSMPVITMPLKRKANEALGLTVNLRGIALAAGLGAVASFLNMATSSYDGQRQVGSAGLNIVH